MFSVCNAEDSKYKNQNEKLDMTRLLHLFRFSSDFFFRLPTSSIVITTNLMQKGSLVTYVGLSGKALLV